MSSAMWQEHVAISFRPGVHHKAITVWQRGAAANAPRVT